MHFKDFDCNHLCTVVACMHACIDIVCITAKWSKRMCMHFGWFGRMYAPENQRERTHNICIYRRYVFHRSTDMCGRIQYFEIRTEKKFYIERKLGKCSVLISEHRKTIGQIWTIFVRSPFLLAIFARHIRVCVWIVFSRYFSFGSVLFSPLFCYNVTVFKFPLKHRTQKSKQNYQKKNVFFFYFLLCKSK